MVEVDEHVLEALIKGHLEEGLLIVGSTLRLDFNEPKGYFVAISVQANSILVPNFLFLESNCLEVLRLVNWVNFITKSKGLQAKILVQQDARSHEEVGSVQNAADQNIIFYKQGTNCARRKQWK